MKKQSLILSIVFALLIPQICHATDWCADSNMAAAWKMDEASGTLADCTANANTMTATGSPGAYNAAGKKDGAFDFQEVNNAGFSATDQAAIRNITKLSAGCWTNFDTNGNAGASFIDGGWMVGKYDGADGWAVGSDNDAEPSEIDFSYQWTGGKGRWNTSTDPLAADSTYEHVAVTYDAASATNDPIFYYNGVSQALTEINTPATAADDDTGGEPTLGIDGDGTDVGSVNEYDGRLDEVFVYKITILNSTQINDLKDNYLVGAAASSIMQIIKKDEEWKRWQNAEQERMRLAYAKNNS